MVGTICLVQAKATAPFSPPPVRRLQFCGGRQFVGLASRYLQEHRCGKGDLGRYGGINEDFVLVGGWGECKADGSQEMVEGVGKVLVKAVEQRALRVGEDLVSGDRVKESSGERSVDAMEE